MIVSPSQMAAQRIQEWLPDGLRCDLATGAAQALARCKEMSYDLLIINAPLRDGSAEALCADCAQDTLLLVPQDAYEATCARMEPLGVLTLAKPLSPALFRQALSLLRAARAKVRRAEGKLEEVRAVTRAKWVLIQTLQMSEAQAHRYIEKQAMDLRISRRDVAENIIRTYEN